MPSQSRYAMIADVLTKEVAEGRWAVGETLPGEADLCERFGVARNTLRQAIGVLQEMGLVAPQRGIGTVVRAKKAAPRYVHAVESLDSMFDYLQATELHVIETRQFVARGEICLFLRSKEGVGWIDVVAVRTARREAPVISYSHLYVPQVYGQIVSQMNGLRKPTYSLIEQLHGKVVAEVDQSACVDTMPAAAATHLGVKRNSPAQVVDRHYLSETGEVLFASRSYYPPGRFSLSIKLRRVSPAGSVTEPRAR